MWIDQKKRLSLIVLVPFELFFSLKKLCNCRHKKAVMMRQITVILKKKLNQFQAHYKDQKKGKKT